MPLQQSDKPAAISANIAAEKAAGKSQRVAVAIAMAVADRAKKAREKRGK